MTEPTQLVVSQEADLVAMVAAIIGAYHTTRLAEMSAAMHLLSQPSVRKAIQRAMNQSFLAGLEKAAVVADMRARVFREMDGPCALSLQEECEDIASFIRSLSIEEGGA